MKIEPILLTVLQKCSYRIYSSLLRLNCKFNCLKATVKNGAVEYSVLPVSKPETFEDVPGRQTIKFVSFLQKHLKLPESELLKFVEAVNAEFFVGESLEYKIISGEEIRKAYLIDNAVPNPGFNLQSCMTDRDSQLYLDLYVYNPETFQLLVAYHNSKVAGRTLLYKGYRTRQTAIGRRKPVRLRGRVYAASQVVHRCIQTHAASLGFIAWNDGVEIGTNRFRRKTFYFPLQHWDLNYYPWMDNSLQYLDCEHGILTNRKLFDNARLLYQGGFECIGSYGVDLPRPDPHRPGLMYIERKWRDEATLIKTRGGFTPRERAIKCGVCGDIFDQYSVRLISLNGNPSVPVCGTHLIAYVDGHYVVRTEK